MARIPRELEASDAAVMNCVREVEKNIHALRDLTARELDRQNAHIVRVKAAYGAVLQQEARNVGAIMKMAAEVAMGDLLTTLESSPKTLKEAVPCADETIPQPRQFPQPAEGTPRPGGAPKPK